MIEACLLSLEDAIEKQIKEYESKAENDVKNAKILERDADIFGQNGIWDRSSRKYQDSADLFRRACIFLESINLMTTGLKEEFLEKLKLRKTDERYANDRNSMKEYYRKSADLYKKASEVYGRLPNRFLQANMLGMAAKAYLRVFELSDEGELKTDYKPGEVYSYSETLCGTIVSLYSSAANFFNELGIEFEESGKKSKAYIFYGYVGDAYLSIALVRGKDSYWPFGSLGDQAYDYLYAAEAYYKSGKLNKEIGVASIVQYARMEWEHAQRGVFDFFTDENGYSTGSDLKRALIAYGKAKELYDNLNMKTQAEYCSNRVREIQKLLEQMEQKVTVDAEATIRIRSPGKTGYAWSDNELPKIVSRLKESILPEDLDSYQIVLASMLNYMAQNLQENFFKDQKVSEKDFQKDLLRHLRSDRDIGEDAFKEVSTGAGFVDILVKGVPVELKLEKTEKETAKVIKIHENQACQYASAQAKQVGILCILDLTEKDKPPPPPPRDIHVETVAVHGYEKDKLSSPSILAIFMIRGNLPSPSAI